MTQIELIVTDKNLLNQRPTRSILKQIRIIQIRLMITDKKSV